MCQRLVGPLVGSDDHGRAKTCALALSHFLGKDIVSVEEIIRQYRACSTSDSCDESPTDQACLESLLCNLLKWMGRADFGSIAGQLISRLLDGAQDIDTAQSEDGSPKDTPLWADVLERATRDLNIDVATLRVHLLPMLLKRGASDYYRFMNSLGLREWLGVTRPENKLREYTQEALLCASLQAAKALDMVREFSQVDIVVEGGVLYIPTRSVAGLLQRTSPT
ncbi:hypothetical protein LTR53_018391, partial [Teratosphaeriaceae sp. CCFEE 6253]